MGELVKFENKGNNELAELREEFTELGKKLIMFGEDTPVLIALVLDASMEADNALDDITTPDDLRAFYEKVRSACKELMKPVKDLNPEFLSEVADLFYGLAMMDESDDEE